MDLEELIATSPGLSPGGLERLPGYGRRLHKKSGGGSGPAPDPNIGAAALQEAQLGRDWLQFSREQFNIGNSRQDKLDALTNQVTEAQLQAMRDNNKRGQEADDFYKKTFRPLEEKVATEAANYDSQERQNQMAGEAVADVSDQLALRKAARDRSMARMGVSPTSGRYQTASNSDAIDEALATASAANGARSKVREMGIMLRKDAANFGRNMPSTAAASYGVGLNAGNSALSNNIQANQAWGANGSIMAQGFQGAIGATGASAGILNQQYGNQVAAWQAQQQANSASAAGLGSAVSGIGMAAATYF